MREDKTQKLRALANKWFERGDQRTASIYLLEAIELETKRPRGRPPTGFDKKAYDRDRMRRIRAENKAKREEKK